MPIIVRATPIIVALSIYRLLAGNVKLKLPDTVYVPAVVTPVTGPDGLVPVIGIAGNVTVPDIETEFIVLGGVFVALPFEGADPAGGVGAVDGGGVGAKNIGPHRTLQVCEPDGKKFAPTIDAHIAVNISFKVPTVSVICVASISASVVPTDSTVSPPPRLISVLPSAVILKAVLLSTTCNL